MFFYFFTEYKEKIYKGSRRKLVWYEIAAISVAILWGILMLLALVFHWSMAAAVVCTLSCFIPYFIVAIVIDRKNRNQQKQLLKGYKEDHIAPLRDLLKRYGLCTESGIDWLISCCDEKREKNTDFSFLSGIKDGFVTVFYPLIMLLIGAGLKELEPKTALFWVGLAFAAFMLFAGMYLILRPFFSWMQFPDKNIVEYLEDDLKYIKAQGAYKK